MRVFEIIWRSIHGIWSLLLKFFASLKATTWGQWIMFYLFTYLGGLIGKALGLIGVTLVVNEFVTPELTPLISTHLLGMPVEWQQLLALTKIDQAVTVIMSAIAIAVASRVYVARHPTNDWGEPL